TDPVDFILTDAKARENGYTADRGPISETAGSYNSGAGALKLVIAPFTSGSYDLELVGVGEGPVLFGAALITPNDQTSEPQSSPARSLPIVLESLAQVVLVLDFSDPETPGAPPPSGPAAVSSPTAPT